jgi:hypothetical protein
MNEVSPVPIRLKGKYRTRKTPKMQKSNYSGRSGKAHRNKLTGDAKRRVQARQPKMAMVLENGKTRMVHADDCRCPKVCAAA